ncbi:AraC family transcriptional regulator [Spirosoma taeanense]|uniref:AraC family transcriptional regulator n=1 Tax=Spirosoma taeanense TaxID=2735870 RepID=A0A6M5Y3T6_9BACT|nr:AraC family transcriptional regulator [Spirosoma taeanense]QJW88040.1 AraC family transcriptional regulator [Spirosoma taeanense]
MKALFEKVTIAEQSSLLVRRFQLPYFDAPWHYHPEYELTFIARGYGQRFVGDHVEPFLAGDLVLLGPDLPHFWRSDETFYQPDNPERSESVVAQFPASLIQNGLLTLPEAKPVLHLLERARYGLRFSPAVSAEVAPQMQMLVNRTDFDQLLNLLTILNRLAADHEASLLASDGYRLAPSEAETERMKRVLEYVLAHFREEMRIEQIASVAGMSSAAFCRYFKKKTRKSFVEYVNELRIGNARKLLANNDLSVAQVGLECGFNNISHFHRQFKLHTGVTPLRYQVLSRSK